MEKQPMLTGRREFFQELLHPVKNLARKKNAVTCLNELMATEGKGERRRKQMIEAFNGEINSRNKILGIQTTVVASFLIALGRATCSTMSNLEKEDPASMPIPSDNETAKESVLSVGPFEFVFNEGIPKEQIERITKIIKSAHPEIIKYIPLSQDLWKKIDIKPSPTNNWSFASYEKGEILLGEKFTDGLFVHELVHLYHGGRDLSVNFTEEGIATAVSILTTRVTKLQSWDTTRHLELSDSLKNGGLAVMSYVPFEQYPPLLNLRYHMSAKLWLDLEKIRPGFIYSFHEKYYKFLDDGGDKNDLFDLKTVEILKSISPEFDQVAVHDEYIGNNVFCFWMKHMGVT